MPKVVSATEAKNRLRALIGWVSRNRDEVIVESHGEPTAVIISFAEYQRLRELREQARRKTALETLRELRQRTLASNADLSPGEADALADAFSRDLVDDLVSRGQVRFEE